MSIIIDPSSEVSQALCTSASVTLGRSEILEVGNWLVDKKNLPLLKKTDKQIVWHLAMTKSGSTWISNVLGNGLIKRGWKSTRLIPAGGFREQEIDPRLLLQNNYLDYNLFAEHQHSSFSDYAVDFIRNFNIKVILQVRSIPDCIVSITDHYEKEGVRFPTSYMTKEEWKQLSTEDKQSFAVNLVAPWYIRYWAGWSSILKLSDINVELVRYEELVKTPNEHFMKLAKYCDANVTDDEVKVWLEEGKQTDIRLNKGVVGRGESLPNDLKKHLQKLTSYYKNTDFSIVGL